MPLQQGSEVSRRRLLAAGTGVFSSREIDDLKEVPNEIKAIQRVFHGLGFDLEPKANDLDHANLLTRCSDFRNSAAAGDVLVAYYTSHGVRDHERFYLLTSDSDLKDLDGTAVAAEDLARRLIKYSKARQVLIILDMCFAGAGLADIAKLAGSLAFTAGDLDPELYVIAAAGIKQTAKQSAFAKALTAVLRNVDERLAGRAQPYLHVGSLVAEINASLEKAGRQRARWSCLNSLGECLALPNPNYRNNIRPGLDLETQNAYEEHWIPKARSGEMGMAGWYFTGREEVLRQLVDWLGQPRSDCKVRVVTGSAGTGKSALLARIVTLSDPRLRSEILGSGLAGISSATIPPEEVVNAALVVRRKLLDDVVLELANQLSLEATDASGLREAIANMSKKIVLIIDALDEADERQAIVDELLRPLVEQPHVFLLLGSRPDPQAYNSQTENQVEAFAGVSVELDLDDPTYGKAEDVSEYLRRRLLATEEPGRRTPYQKSPQQAEVIAKALAKRSDYSFLVARTVLPTLLSRPEALDVTLQGWEDELPSGFEEALEQFLQELDGSSLNGISITNARAILQALAFAEGEGLPWENIWATVASAISKSPISDDHIRQVRRHAASFIVEALENGRSVYRLFHERAAEVLRNRINQKDAHEAIVRELQEGIPRISDLADLDWPQADPYILSHLPAHAFKAGILGQFTSDQLFLAACDPARFQAALNYLPMDVTTAVYTTAYFNLIKQSIEQRLAYLELAARQLGANNLADVWQVRDLKRLWQVKWARWRPPTPHRKISLESEVAAIALWHINDRCVIFSASVEASSTVHINAWDLATGQSFGSPVNWYIYYNYITALGTGTLMSRPVIICAGFIKTGECIISVWDLVTGKEACSAISISGISYDEHKSWVKSVSISSIDERPVIIICNQNIYVWNPLDNSLIRSPLKGVGIGAPGQIEWPSNSPVCAVALASVNNKTVIASGGTDECIRVWDLETGQLCYMPLLGHKSTINDIAIVPYKGRVFMVTASSDCTIRKWDLADGRPIGEPIKGHEGKVNALALAFQDGRHMIISGSNDSTIRLWDLENGHAIGSPMQGHDGSVDTISVGQLGNQSFIISGSEDKTMRIWHIESGRISGAPTQGHHGYINTLAIQSVDGKPVIITGSDDKTLRVWDLYTGGAIGTPLVGHEGPISKIATVSQKTSPIIISGAWDHTIRSWDMLNGRAVGSPIDGHTDNITAIAIGYIGEKPVIVSGSRDNSVRIWDVSNMEAPGLINTIFKKQVGPIHPGIPMHSSLRRSSDDMHITSLAFGIVNDQDIVISGSESGCISIWALASGELLHTSTKLHTQEINSIIMGEFENPPVYISAGYDGTIRMWTLDDLVSDRSLENEYELNRQLLDLQKQKQDAVQAQEYLAAAEVHVKEQNLIEHVHTILKDPNANQADNIGHTLKAEDEVITSIALGCLGGHHVIISASESVCDHSSDSTIRIWDLSNRRPWHAMPLPIRIGARVNAVEIFDNTLVACGDDGFLMIELPCDQEI